MLKRARCQYEMENFEESVKDYELALKMDKSMETKNALKDAKLQLKKSKRKDYYKILGITKSASDDEIKKAYRKRGECSLICGGFTLLNFLCYSSGSPSRSSCKRHRRRKEGRREEVQGGGRGVHSFV